LRQTVLFRHRTGIALLVYGWASAVLPAAGPVPQTPPPDKAALKLVQVYAFDKKSRAVTDLTAADFAVTEGGKARPIALFENHTRPASGAPVSIPALNRKYFLVFDFMFNDLRGSMRAKGAGLHFLDTGLAAADEVAVLSVTTQKNLAVHEYLTADHEKARQAIMDLGNEAFSGRAEHFERLLTRPQTAAGDQAAQEKSGARDFGQENYRDQVIQYLMTLKDLASSLSLIPGHKTVILFSGGVARVVLSGSSGDPSALIEDPYRTVEGALEYSRTLDTMFGDSGVQREFGRLLKVLKDSNAAVFCVDTPMPRAQTGRVGEKDVRGSDFMRQLADNTGGEFFSGTQDLLKAVETIRAMTAPYYVLGYDGGAAAAAESGVLKVSVGRKGIQVRHSTAVGPAASFAGFDDFEKRLHLFDLVLADNPRMQAPAGVAVKAFPVYGEDFPKLGLLAHLDEGADTGLRGPRVEVLVLLFDGRKNLINLARSELNLGAGAAGGVDLSGLFALQPGLNICGIFLRNLETGRSARGFAEVNLPIMAGGLRVSPPLWMASPTSPGLRFSLSKDSLAKVYPFEPAEGAPLIESLPAGTAKLKGYVRWAYSGTQVPEISFSAQVVDHSSGKRLDAPVAVLEQTPGEGSVLVAIETAFGALAPGTYSLYFFVLEKGAAARLFISSFTVR